MEKIVGANKIQGGGLLYRVRWYSYSREEDTWEPADNLPEEVVMRYHQRNGLPRGA
jgi:Chromo (CHRromatin Organisation MOdifier) domain